MERGNSKTIWVQYLSLGSQSGINLLKTETMVSKNQATEAEGRGSRVFRDHSLGFKKV